MHLKDQKDVNMDWFFFLREEKVRVCTFFILLLPVLERDEAYGEKCDYNNSKINYSQRELGFSRVTIW